MIAVVQRVSRAAVRVGHEVAGEIGAGVLILLGVAEGDEDRDTEWTARKCAGLRIFRDDEGRMNRSVLESGGAALVVSQFTLLGDCNRGRRPSFGKAAPPEMADRMYQEFVDRLRAEGVPTQTGVFRAMMDVELVNDGPVTLIIDSKAGRSG